jgi:hypothetical protein
MRIAALGFVAATLVLGSGCGKKAEDKDRAKGAQRRPSDPVLLQAPGETDSDAVTLSQGEAARIPPDFPKDVPVPDAMRVLSAAADRSQMAVNFECVRSVRDLTAFYKRQLKDNGWEVNPQLESPLHAILSGGKSGRLLSLAMTEIEGKSKVELSVTAGD